MDDEPDEVDDSEAEKPEDWDDEEDGEWEPPKISNPRCEEAPGCGEWKRPMKANPAYKGKWRAPMIDNPTYQGIWAPRQIPNEDYFELEKPNLEAVAAIGIEIWTMQDGILFDNILVAHDEKVAEEYRKTTWEPKYLIEKEKIVGEKEDEKEDKSSTGIEAIKVISDILFNPNVLRNNSVTFFSLALQELETIAILCVCCFCGINSFLRVAKSSNSTTTIFSVPVWPTGLAICFLVKLEPCCDPLFVW